jgi:hypothetical protein
MSQILPDIPTPQSQQHPLKGVVGVVGKGLWPSVANLWAICGLGVGFPFSAISR